MPDRRSVLGSTVALLTGALAGCTAFGEETGPHYVDMMNGDDEAHVFTVGITNSAGDTIFEHEYDLGANESDENRVVDGTPSEISVAVDDAHPVTLPWAPDETAESEALDCPGETTPGMTLYYDQQQGDGVTPTYECETVRQE